MDSLLGKCSGQARGQICLDGGLASTLERNGADLSTGKLWSARLLRDDPDAISCVHMEFLRAGVDIITTASYQATVPGLCDELRMDVSAAQGVIRRSVQLAKQAVYSYHSIHHRDGPRALVAASVGPYGAYLANGSEYRGDYQVSIDDLRAFHAERVHLLVEESPDFIAFETIPCVLEAEAIAQLMTSEHPAFPFWISFQCRSDTDLAEGVPVEVAVHALASRSPSNLIAVGVNCVHPRSTASLLHRIRNALDQQGRRDVQLVCYPNSGEAWSEERGWHWSVDDALTPMQWSTIVLESAAQIVGGCCRIPPDWIETLALLRSRVSYPSSASLGGRETLRDGVDMLPW